jgi:hypothetical protein
MQVIIIPVGGRGIIPFLAFSAECIFAGLIRAFCKLRFFLQEILYVIYLQKTCSFTHFFQIRYFFGIYGKRGRILRAMKQYFKLMGGGKEGAEGYSMGQDKRRPF